MRIAPSVVALGLVLVGCDATTAISPDVAQKAIQYGLEDRGLVVTSVACPPDQHSKVGAKFSCMATLATGDMLPVDVDVLDDSGHVKWDVRGVIVHEKLMGAGVEAKLGGGIRVTCPDRVTAVAVGGSFTCDTSGGNVPTKHVVITIVDAKGTESSALTP